MAITTCVFDAYGTLFDVTAAARNAAAEPGREALAEKAADLANIWRLKQLQYTWLRAVSNAHTDFWEVTQDGLDFAMEATGLNDPKNKDMKTAILSNGSPDMLKGAVDSAGIGELLDAVLSVEDVGVFKPHKSVYDLVGQHFGCEPAEVLFVSSNGWDAAAASGYGFTTLWVNRAGDPVDRLPWKPQKIASDLSGVADLLETL